MADTKPATSTPTPNERCKMSVISSDAGSFPAATRLAMAVNDVAEEVERAMQKHGAQRSAHESYAVILEEVEEFWDEVMKKSSERSPSKMREELVQISAMAIRAIVDLNLNR